MKRALKWISLSFGGLLAFCVIILLVLWFKPGIWLNEPMLSRAAQYLPQLGYSASWDQARVHVGTDGAWNRRVSIGFGGLCVKSEDGAIDACFEKFEVAAAMSVQGFRFRVTDVGPIDVRGGRLALDLEKMGKSEPQTEAPGERGEFLPTWLRGARVHSVEIGIDSWRLALRSGGLSGNARVANERVGDTAWKWVASTAVRFNDGRHAEFSGELRPWQADDLRPYLLHASWIDGAKVVVAKIDGKFGPQGLRGSIDASARGFIPQIPRARLDGCAFELKKVRGAPGLGDFDLNCPVVARTNFPPVESLPDVKTSTEIRAKVTAHLRTPFPPDPARSIKGQVRLDLDPVVTPIVQGEGFIAADLAGVPNEFPKNWKLDTQVDLKLAIRKFQQTVSELQRTSWAVPAPFNTLDGTVEVGASGHMDLSSASIPLILRTRLTSKYQRLNLDGSGEFGLTRALGKKGGDKTDLRFDLLLSDVRLALPRLDLESPPRFLPDSRIKSGAGQKSEKTKEGSASQFSYRATVKTPPGHPVMLVSNLAKEPIPVHIDLSASSDAAPGGTVRVTDFPLMLFRRNASVERFLLTIDPSTGKETVDGSIRVAYTDYVIHVLVSGPADEPQIKLVSDPPVPEDQLMAVLLFGKELDELDPGQTESIGQTRAAVYDNAIGLASLYYLASTPIESVGYDPNTGAFNAKVRLGEGTSLNVGQRAGQTGEENADFIGVRKRLSRFWTITTDVAQSAGSDGGTASAFLEWSNRY